MVIKGTRDFITKHLNSCSMHAKVTILISKCMLGEGLKGIIINWSDTEAKGLRELLGENVADKVIEGCNVHWTRSYQRVADKVNNNVHRSNRVLAKEPFCAVAKQMMVAKTKEKC